MTLLLSALSRLQKAWTKLGISSLKGKRKGYWLGFGEFPSVLMEEGKADVCTRRRTMDKYLKKLFDLEVGKNCNVKFREEVGGDNLHVFSHIQLHMPSSKSERLALLENEDQSVVIWKCVDGNSIKSMGLTSSVCKVYNMIQDFKEKQLSQQEKVAKRKRTKITI